QSVTESAIFGRQHGMGGLADERMSEDVFVLAGESRVIVRYDELAPHELVPPRVHRASRCALAENCFDAAPPERFAENARHAQKPSRIGLHRTEPRLYRRENGVGKSFAASFGDRSNQFLQKERIAARTFHEPS